MGRIHHVYKRELKKANKGRGSLRERSHCKKKVAEKIPQFLQWVRLRKHDTKGSQKRTRMFEIDFQLPTLKTAGNQSMSPIPSSSSNNGIDFINQMCCKIRKSAPKKGLEIIKEEKNWN